MSSDRLSGRRALITGGSRGIGRAIASLFVAEGADVALTARSEEALQPVVTSLARSGRRVLPFAWDLRDVSQTDRMVPRIQDVLGGLDILVNNAGVVRLPNGCTESARDAEWDYVLDINLKGLYFLCERVADSMAHQGSGTIVNIASDAGLRGAPNAYGISKWGVIGYTRGLAKRLSQAGIRVNAVAPGPVATAMMGCPDGEPKDWPAGPLGRYAVPEEVAQVALFLVSDASSAVFGQTIVVNSADW